VQPLLNRTQNVVRPATVDKFLRSHHSVRRQTNQRRLTEIKTAVALTNDPAVLNSANRILRKYVRVADALCL